MTRSTQLLGVEVPDVGDGVVGSPTECTTRKPDRYGFSIRKKPRNVGFITMITLRLRPRSSGSTSARK